MKLLEKLTERSSLAGLIDYSRILKALIILFLLYILYESLERNTSRFQFRCCENSVKTLRYFKMTLPLFQVLQISLPIPLSLCHIKSGSVG